MISRVLIDVSLGSLIGLLGYAHEVDYLQEGLHPMAKQARP